ncbi:MAG: sulfotransferase [Albidovulum sp.]
MIATPQPEPTILFGLGANKAGSTWLYRYLSRHPDCRMPDVKELHFFDAVTAARRANERRKVENRRDQLVAQLVKASPVQAVALRERLADLDDWLGVIAQDQSDDGGYRGYLLRRAQGSRLIGDITPAYALLPEAELARMQAMGPSVRFLYILRDPIDRLWSNIRMNAQRHLGMNAGRAPDAPDMAKAVAQKALRIFDTWADGGEAPVSHRSDYMGTLTRLTQAVLPSNLRVMFYETMFNKAAIDRLCGFLGIAPHPAAIGKPVNAGGTIALDMPRQLRARELLAPQYEFVRQTMGDVPLRWRMNMGEL